MSTPQLISISGSVHSGKTTISRMLAAAMPNAFYVDGDLVATWVQDQTPSLADATIDELLPEVHKKIIELIRAGLKEGLDVIVDYPFSDKTRTQIIDNLQDVMFEAKWFLLKPKIEKVLTGSASRPGLNQWEVDRINYHYNESNLLKTTMATVIDSTEQTPEETYQRIKGLIKNQGGKL